MVWGRKKTQPAADTPRWNQDDYHQEFAGTLKAQIAAGVVDLQRFFELHPQFLRMWELPGGIPASLPDPRRRGPAPARLSSP